MRKFFKLFSILLAFTLALFLFKAGFAGAVNTGTVGILPANPDPQVKNSSSWFIYNLDLGQRKEDALRVINNKDEAVIIKIYAVDATVTSDGSFALLSEDAERKDVGSWVKLALNEVEIPPKTEKLIPFIISIPANADVGDHAGGIVIQEIERSPQKVSGTGISIITRVGVRIYETVPGEVIKDYEISRFDWRTDVDANANFIKRWLGFDRKTIFFVGIENKGNVRLSPKSKIRITNIFGRVSGEIPESEMGEIFPRTKTADSAMYWKGMPIMGRYKAVLTVNFAEEAQSKTKEIIIWAFPYRLFAILFFLCVFFVLARLVRQYIQESKKEKMPIYTALSSDKIVQLANNFHIKWKKLAKINDLKKPYEFKNGDKLFIPIKDESMDYFRKLYNEGRIELPIAEQSGVSKRSHRKFFKALILVGIILLGLAVYRFKFRSEKGSPAPATSEIKTNQGEDKQKTEEKETTKKSSIEVKLCTLSGADPISTSRLQNKLKLIGYGGADILGGCAKFYNSTTIESSPENKEQADIVKNDLGASTPVDTVEIPDAGKEIIIYNELNKDDLIEIKQISRSVSAVRELIKITVANSGAADGKAEEVKNILLDAGYSVSGDISQERNSSTGIIVEYGDNSQKDNAESVKNFLIENGYASATTKKTVSSSDSLTLIVGK